MADGAADQVGQVVSSVSEGLGILGQLSAEMSPEAAQKIEQAMSLVQEAAEMMGGGAPAPEQPPQGQTAVGAQPVGPAGVA